MDFMERPREFQRDFRRSKEVPIGLRELQRVSGRVSGGIRRSQEVRSRGEVQRISMGFLGSFWRVPGALRSVSGDLMGYLEVSGVSGRFWGFKGVLIGLRNVPGDLRNFQVVSSDVRVSLGGRVSGGLRSF